MNLIANSTAQYPEVNNTWDAVRYWLSLSARFSRASVACQVMGGFALLDLKAAHGVTNGDNQHEGRVSRCGKPYIDVSANQPLAKGTSTWEDILDRETGLSKTTAYKWMDMASGIKSRWKNLPIRDRLRALVETPSSQWSEVDVKLITDAVHKVTDGYTQTEFLQELGLAKLPSGNARPTGGPHKERSLEEQMNLAKETAAKDWERIDFMLEGYGTNFCLLPDQPHVTAQIAALERAIAWRQAWLRQPREKRDVGAIREMMRKR